MLIASLIFVLSFAAMIQFAALSWRSGLLRLAATPLAFESELVAELSRKAMNTGSFQEVKNYQKLCPNLAKANLSGPTLGAVGVYYRILQVATCLGNTASNWARGEMATCTRYAAVQLSHRLARTQVLATELGSY
jgi:hypothetical protein